MAELVGASGGGRREPGDDGDSGDGRDDARAAPETVVRPLQVRQLPRDLRPAALAAVGAIGGWCLALLVTATGLGIQFDPQGAYYGLMDGGTLGPAVVRVATAASLAAVLAAATAAARHPGWAGSRSARAGRRLVLLAVVATGLVFVDATAVHAGPLTADSWAEFARLIWGSGLGWAAMATTVALLLLPLSSAAGRRLAVPLAVLPLATWLLVAFGNGALTRPWLIMADWRTDQLLYTIEGLAIMLVLFLVWEVVAWTELVAAGAAGLVRRLPAGPRGRALVTGLLAIKLAWVSAGLAGVLPGVLGGHAAVWRSAATDGLGSWALAGMLATVVVVAVSRRRGPAPAARLPLTPLLVTLAVLLAPGLLAGVIDFVRVLASDAWPTGVLDLAQGTLVLLAAGVVVLAVVAADQPEVPGPNRRFAAVLAVHACLILGYLAAALQGFVDRPAIERIDGWLPLPGQPYGLYEVPGLVTAHYFLAPGAAFVVATMLALRARRAAADAATEAASEGEGDDDGRDREAAWLVPAVFAVALAGVALLYVLPRLPQVPLGYDIRDLGASGGELAPFLSHLVYELRPAGWESGWNGPAGTFEVVSFDAALTVGLCWLARRWWQGPDEAWRTVAFVLVGSTVLAHSSTVMPGGWLGNHWYYVGFVVPVAWQLVLRADELNDLVGRRPALAVLNLALIALLMTVIGYRLLTGGLNPTVQFEDAVFPYGRGLTIAIVLPPLGVLALGRRLRRLPA